MALKAKEIAEELGISQATLSLIVNNKPGISDTTRKQVVSELIARGYDYLLSAETVKAEGIQTNKETSNIGFVTYKRGGELLGYNSFFPLILDGLEQTARRYGYGLSYINISHEDAEAEMEYIKAAKCKGCVIFATEMKEQDMVPFMKLRIPIVLLDNHFNSLNINSVEVNNEQGVYLAAEYLYKKGHRKVGYLRSGVDIDSFTERYFDTLRVAEKIGLEDVRKYTFTVGYPSEEAYGGMVKVLESNVELPTAFIADNDLVSVGAMRAMKDKGYHLPKDMSFIGFDDRPICSLVKPSLTTIQIPREYFGAEAVELLMRVINDKFKGNVMVDVSGKLIIRESVHEV